VSVRATTSVAALSGGEWLSLCVGSLELLLALVVARRLATFGHAIPWLVAMTAFFALRGATRLLEAVVGHDPPALTLAADGVLLAVLALLILGVDVSARRLRLMQTSAQDREQDYVRALADYRRLARHRLANPLAAIHGNVAALKAFPELDERRRRELLDAVEREVVRLEQVALEPQPASPEERGLRPRPSSPSGPDS
jgi:signal transduction histidine kinase